MYYSQGRDRWFGRIQCAPTMNGNAMYRKSSIRPVTLFKPVVSAVQACLVRETRQACSRNRPRLYSRQGRLVRAGNLFPHPKCSESCYKFCRILYQVPQNLVPSFAVTPCIFRVKHLVLFLKRPYLFRKEQELSGRYGTVRGSKKLCVSVFLCSTKLSLNRN